MSVRMWCLIHCLYTQSDVCLCSGVTINFRRLIIMTISHSSLASPVSSFIKVVFHLLCFKTQRREITQKHFNPLVISLSEKAAKQATIIAGQQHQQHSTTIYRQRLYANHLQQIYLVIARATDHHLIRHRISIITFRIAVVVTLANRRVVVRWYIVVTYGPCVCIPHCQQY